MVTRNVAGETIIVQVAGKIADLDAVFTLNPTGSLIWNLLDGKADASKLAEAVSREFDVSIETARRDTDEFLAVLLDAGMIVQTENHRGGDQ